MITTVAQADLAMANASGEAPVHSLAWRWLRVVPRCGVVAATGASNVHELMCIQVRDVARRRAKQFNGNLDKRKQPGRVRNVWWGRFGIGLMLNFIYSCSLVVWIMLLLSLSLSLLSF